MPESYPTDEEPAGPGVDEREVYDRIHNAIRDNYQGAPVNPGAVATIATAAVMTMLTDHANSHAREHGDDLLAAVARVHQVCRTALATDSPDRWALAAAVRAALEGPGTAERAARNRNADSEALAWARAKVEKVRDKYLAFADRARATGKVETAEQCRRFANLLDMELIGGKGCVIAAFDERRPAFAALEEALPTTEETNR